MNRPGRPKGIQDANRAQDILNEAIKMVASKGFDNTSIRDLASQAGVSLGLIRHYFGSKKELFTACNKEVTHQISSIFEEVFSCANDQSIEENIDTLNAKMIKLVTPKIFYLKYLAHLFQSDDEESRKYFRMYFDAVNSFVTKISDLDKTKINGDKTWATFQIIFLQLGPIMLSPQIANIIGGETFDNDVIKERMESMGRMLKGGLKEA